ncbi:MAG: sodium:proton antiporter [Pseudomonadota bacterium]
MVRLIMLLVLLAAPSTAEAAGSVAHIDGAGLGALWGVPFAGILLSIALFPLLAPHFWHRHFGKIAAFWSLLLLIPLLLKFGVSTTVFELTHIIALEYLPFVILLLALFTISGGICIEGKLAGTPLLNTLMLGFGTALASWTGTTGAAMLLIRPLIAANHWRTKKVHIVIFFIFLVANIGGSLTPLGDPPLFLGFLKGVDFFWPLKNMLLPMLLVSGLVLALFYLLDRYMAAKEPNKPLERVDVGEAICSIRFKGTANFLLLLGVIAAVLMSGLWKPGIYFTVFHVDIALQNLLRDLLLLGLVGLSLAWTPKTVRAANDFTWFPIAEVAKLFIGIFITVAPVIAMLRAGEDGVLGFIIEAVSKDGAPNNVVYFWATGLLSTFLDNAPTYLVFFNTAGGDPAVLTGPMTSTLLAISAGAVFMGANSYIGNAPNFMVRSIAQEQGVPMPSFFGYMIWSVIILFPIFLLVTWVFF